MTVPPSRQRAFDLLLIAAGFVAVWQVFYEVAGPLALASPLQAVRTASGMVANLGFWMDTRWTLSAFGLAVLAETVLGLALGVLLGMHRFAGDLVEPMLASFYAVPKLIFYPVIILACGIGMGAEVVFGVLHGIISITLFTMNAVRTIRPVLLKTGRVLRLSTAQTVLWIAIPGALPEIFTGLRIGICGTLIGVIIFELFGSSQGLGFLLMNAMGNNVVADISSLTLLLIAVATVLSAGLMAVDARLHGKR